MMDSQTAWSRQPARSLQRSCMRSSARYGYTKSNRLCGKCPLCSQSTRVPSGDKSKADTASYRGIYLSSALAKLFEGILISRLTKFTETLLADKSSMQFTACSVSWCGRCSLITKRPKAPSHYRYLNLGPGLHPLYGIYGVQFCDYSCSCVYCDFEFLKFVFSTLQSRSCFKFK